MSVADAPRCLRRIGRNVQGHSRRCEPVVRQCGRRRGFLLLEAIVALSVMAIVGVAMLALISDSTHRVWSARERNVEIMRANALLEAIALWPVEDLDRHLGDHAQGELRLRIERRRVNLYDVVLTEGGSGRQLLVTALYRERANVATQ